MKRFAIAAAVTGLTIATFGCASQSGSNTEGAATTEKQAVKEMGTLPAGAEALAELGVDHWTVYQTSQDVMIIVGRDKDNHVRHAASMTGATDPNGVYYAKEVKSDARARNLTYSMKLDNAGKVLSSEGDPTAAYGTSLLRKDIEEASLHQEKYGWFACIAWSIAAIGTCGAAAAGCFTAGVFTGGTACYFGGVACIGNIGGAIDACIHRDETPGDPGNPLPVLTLPPPCADGDTSCCLTDDDGQCINP